MCVFSPLCIAICECRVHFTWISNTICTLILLICPYLYLLLKRIDAGCDATQQIPVFVDFITSGWQLLWQRRTIHSSVIVIWDNVGVPRKTHYSCKVWWGGGYCPVSGKHCHTIGCSDTIASLWNEGIAHLGGHHPPFLFCWSLVPICKYLGKWHWNIRQYAPIV